MLARVLAMVLYLSVCLSVTSWCSTETDERIELVFGTGASLHLPCPVDNTSELWVSTASLTIMLCLQRDYVARVY